MNDKSGLLITTLRKPEYQVRSTMKRIISITLCALLLIFCSAPAFAVNEDVTGELVIYTSMYQFAIKDMDEALKKEFPNLTPGNNGSFFFYGGSSDLITRIYGQMENNQLDCDMLLVAEPSFALELKERGYLEPVMIENAENRFRFPYDKDGYWYPVRVCNMVLAFNPEKEAYWQAKGVNIPRSFKDFANDKSLDGYISMGNPMTSGTAFAAVSSLTQNDPDHYGPAYLDALAANHVAVTSGSVAIAKLQDSECAAIMILEESVFKYISDERAKGNEVKNIKCIYPDDGVILIPSPVMTIAEQYSLNANIEACEAVENWLMTDEAQKVIVSAFMHSPIANFAQVPDGSLPTDELIRKDKGVDWENAYQNRESIKTMWTEKITTAK